MLGLTQAGTNITVARDTDVEIPAEAVDGNLVARLVQHRGNVFYDVAHRDVGKLRVETPYLVAVIKGTQFNVAVQEDSTTISLFEGRLEIRTPDGSDVIQLNAGEIAIRSSTDGAIRVLGMNEERVEAPRAAGRARDNAVAAVQPDQTPAAAVRARRTSRGSASAGTTDARREPRSRAEHGGSDERRRARRTPDGAHRFGPRSRGDGNAGLDARASVDLGVASAGLGVAVDSGGVDAAVSAKVDLGAANVGRRRRRRRRPRRGRSRSRRRRRHRASAASRADVAARREPRSRRRHGGRRARHRTQPRRQRDRHRRRNGCRSRRGRRHRPRRRQFERGRWGRPRSRRRGRRRGPRHRHRSLGRHGEPSASISAARARLGVGTGGLDLGIDLGATDDVVAPARRADRARDRAVLAAGARRRYGGGLLGGLLGRH